jgi:Spy/CpxP family protein refolding chaperone
VAGCELATRSRDLDEFKKRLIWMRNPQRDPSLIAKERIMPITPEQREMVAGELKRFATDLNLSEDQKQKLHGFLSEAYDKVQEYKQQNPGVTKEDLIKKVADNRATIRQRLVSFLTPEQLTKWDAEATKAKEFLGQKLAA